MATIQSTEIIPGKGFGQIKLGMAKNEVEELLGKPGETEEHLYPEGGKSETYSYLEEGFDLTFESENRGLLSYISVFKDKFHIDGKIRIGKSKDEILKIIKKGKYSKPEVEDVGGDDLPGNELVFLKDENLNLWFSEGELDEIQFGPFWKDDDTPLWP